MSLRVVRRASWDALLRPGSIALTGAAICVWALAAACGESMGPSRTDGTRPTIEVRFPTSPTEYDEDGDGLVDLRIAYDDSGGAIDPDRLLLYNLEGIDNPHDFRNLLDGWTIAERSDSLLVAHETIANLLPAGANRLLLRVVDTAGGVQVDTIRVTLPYGALHTTIVTGLRPAPPGGMVYCADDRRLYVSTLSGGLAAIDPDSLTVLDTTSMSNGTRFGPMLCIPGDPTLYVTGDQLQQYDRVTGEWGRWVTGSRTSWSIIASRRDSNRVYVGETYAGQVAIVDRAQSERVGEIMPAILGVDYAWAYALAVLPDDARLYASVWPHWGLLVVDPWANVVRDTIDLAPWTTASRGSAKDAALSNDATRLYVGGTLSIFEIDTRTNRVSRTFDLSESLINNLALSPDERRIFVTTADRWLTPSDNVLLDANTGNVLARFPRLRPDSTTRWDGEVVFHPSGKLAFVSHNENVDVYLNRR